MVISGICNSTFSNHHLDFSWPHAWPGFKFLKWCKNAENHETIFIALFKLETSNKYCFIQNESIYVYMKYHSNQALFTQLIFLYSYSHFCYFKMFFLWNILQNQSSGVPEYFEDYCTMPSYNSVVKELTQAVAW